MFETVDSAIITAADFHAEQTGLECLGSSFSDKDLQPIIRQLLDTQNDIEVDMVYTHEFGPDRPFESRIVTLTTNRVHLFRKDGEITAKLSGPPSATTRKKSAIRPLY